MKKIILPFIVLITFFSFATSAQAKMIDGLAIIVEGEAVTTAEIRAVQNQMGISKSEAIDLLIQDRLQKSAMKDIAVSEKDIDKKIADIAAQNSVTIPQMQKILQKRDTTWIHYRKSIREALKKEKFYQEKVLSSIPTPRQEELKLYYKNHQEVFTIPTSISMIEYSAKSKEAMGKFLRTQNKKHIKSRKVTKKTKNLEPALLSTLLQAQENSYTRPFNAGDRYIIYFIKSKKGLSIMPYENAQGMVAAKWKQEQQNKVLKDYFEKMKTRADIQILR